MSLTVLDAALSMSDAGLCVLPAASDGSKRPGVGKWEQYQSARPSVDQLRGWFGSGRRSGLGVVCGAVSGHLEMLELEGRAMSEGLLGELAELATASGLGDLWTAVLTGYMERTPSGGLHFLYRVAGTAKPNTKLARRPSTPAELAAWQVSERARAAVELEGDVLRKRLDRIERATPVQVPQVLLETRGEGGWVVTAPSNGSTHSSGGAWELVAGGPATIPTLSEEERDALHTLAGALDRMPPADAPAPSSPAARPGRVPGLDDEDEGGLRPGDDYNQRTAWAELLEPLGARLLYTDSAGVSYWRRPGKVTPGHSATTGRTAEDRLYVMSSAWEPFEVEKPYDKLGVYALLEHRGDIAAAARALRLAGYGTQRSAPAPLPTGSPTPPAGGPAATTPAPSPDSYTFTDDGNAQRLVDAIGGELRYVPQRDRWLTWAGSRWSWDELGEVTERAREVVRGIRPGDDEQLAKHRLKSLSRGSIASAVDLAQSDRRIAVSLTALDSAPFALCTPGGVVDLKAGTLTAADPSNLHTRSAAVAPDPTMPTPRWLRFLDEMFGGDRELIEYVQRLAGYSASGDVSAHVLPFVLGPGGNGKGVLLGVLARLLGDYADTAPPGFLVAGLQQHETELARLQGLRLVVASETNPGDRFDEARVKVLTGGDRITARFMRQDHFTFDPTHTLWLMANHQPAVAAGGPSFWRRVRLIEANYVPPKPDLELPERLYREEGPGILAWVIRGAVEAFGPEGLREPARVLAATAAYRGEEDHLGRFVEDALRIGGGVHIRTDRVKVYAAYEAWCHLEGEHAMPARALYRELRLRIPEMGEERSHGRRLLTGLSLIETEREES